jgi:glucose/arabinose dehydrogenase
MGRALLRTVGAITFLVAAGLMACSLLLPERYAVNAPMIHMMSGWFGADAPDQDMFGARIRVPAGFAIGVFATEVPGVRFLRPLPGGGLLATTPRAGKVWLLAPDRDGDGRSDSARVLLEGLERPHGLDLYESWLYVAEGSGVGRVRIDPGSG